MSDITNDKAWEKIFEHYKILEKIKKNKYVDITADEIKYLDKKEARLMAKVDFRESLPTVMKDESLSILAVKNGLYRIAKNDPFINIKETIETPIIELLPPENIITIDPYNIKSESAALDIAAISGMHNQVFEEDSCLSIRGRLRGSFDFNIKDIEYKIDGVQIEVDGGYESKKKIHLIEAKIGYKNNISIRQLLYPKLFWDKQIYLKKEVKAYVFYLQNDIYRFIPYYYDGEVGYAEHSEEKAFRFKPLADCYNFSLYDIHIDESKINTNIPFPQADRFDKVESMIRLLDNESCTNKEILKSHFDIVDRQIDYYYNVLKWIKIVDEVDNCLVLNQEGIRIANLQFRDRVIELAKIIFSEPIMNDVLNDKNLNRNLFSRYKMNSNSTIDRRLQTVKAWVKYFKNILENLNQ